MPKLNPKEMMEAEAVNLIKTVTDIEEDEENFEICERFVLSNLFYHKFLDPDENKINRSLSGLHQKFLIHAQPEKASAFQSLVKSYKEGDVWNYDHDQHDIKYRILSFLLNLASSPLHTDYSPAELTPEEEEKRVDWLAVLREGEVPTQHLGDEEDLSDWSEDEEDDVSERVLNSLVKPVEDVITRLSPEPSPYEQELSDSQGWMSGHVQSPYWEQEQTLATSHNFASMVENLQEEGGKLGVRTNKLTEYQVLREILWMLRSPVESVLFQLRNGKFVVTELVTIPSLTDGSMRRILTDVLKAINDVHLLKLFLHDDEVIDNIPKTFEAYKSGLNIFLEAFSCDLYKVESSVLKQEDTHTILSVLDTLRPWFSMIHQFSCVHAVAVKGYAENENWFKAVKLLSVLYNALLRNIVPGLMPFLLDTFLRSIEPYFNIIQVWLTEGRLEDWSQEFIFYKDNEPLDEEDDFWNNMFKSHDYKGRLADESIVPLRLLEGLDQKIFVSGKSIEILSKLDHLLNGKFSVKFDEENNNRILFVDFVQNLESQLPKIVKDPTPTKPDVAADLSPEYQAIVRSAEDPYLALAFEEVFKTIQTSILSNTTTLCPPPPSLLLSNSSLDLLMPLEPIMKRSLSPTITSHYTRACSTLVTLFMSDLNLESVLSRARRVFFMEAGDLMHDFCTQLFHLLDRGSSLEIADSASLTLLLQDCLGGRYPSWCDQFSCSYSPPQEHSATPSLDGLNIHLSVPWPLTILLSQHNLDIYNKVFIFLAGVKRSLWALQSVRLSTLAHLEENMEGLADLSSTSQSFADNSLPLGVKQHRLQLLRSWLLYFTTTMHGYFMSRVVHSTELELKEQLQTATDLDMILATHQTYLQRIYDRCFLHPSASMLREAVVMVLGIGLELQQAASSDLPIHTRTLTAWEEKYARCHKFLATTLQAMTAKRKLPHLDGLAIALLHSCPV